MILDYCFDMTWLAVSDFDFKVIVPGTMGDGLKNADFNPKLKGTLVRESCQDVLEFQATIRTSNGFVDFKGSTFDHIWPLFLLGKPWQKIPAVPFELNVEMLNLIHERLISLATNLRFCC